MSKVFDVALLENEYENNEHGVDNMDVDHCLTKNHIKKKIENLKLNKIVINQSFILIIYFLEGYLKN